MTDSTLMAISDRNSAAPVKWTDNALSIGSVSHLGYSDIQSHWWPDYYPYRPYVQPNVTISTTMPAPPNATEMAFKIVGKMLEDGIVESLTVKKFVKLVDDVAGIVRES